MKHAKPVLCAVRVGFMYIMDDLLLSEVQIIEKNREQTKNTTGLYWEVYIRKTKGIIKISGKKKEEKY